MTWPDALGVVAVCARQLDMFSPVAESSPNVAAKSPARERDRVLDHHATNHAQAIAAATAAALAVAARQGTVTAPEVVEEMRARGDGWLLTKERRWLGAVLLPSRGWERTGELARTGSRGRPVPVWRRAR